MIEDEALRRIVTEYTREAGVRNVERLIQKVLRKSAKKLAEGAETPITVVAGDLRELLGRPRPDVDMARRESVAGVATGLAVTGSGGDVLVVEATEMAGKGLTLTGQLGDVMSESATIALSYVRSHGDQLGIDVAALAEREVHVHVPAGAIPKDGPSAGVTMTVALVSLMSGRAVRADVGMTGEVTLQGRVLPVGGIKQKVLAAHRAGLTDVILPVAQRRRPRRAPPERARGRALPPRRPRRRGPGGRARAGARRDRLATGESAGRRRSPPKENAGGHRTPFPMKTIFSFVGFVVVMILLASTGVMKGDACLSNVGCVGANGGGNHVPLARDGHARPPPDPRGESVRTRRARHRPMTARPSAWHIGRGPAAKSPLWRVGCWLIGLAAVAVGLRFMLWLLGGSAPFALLISAWLIVLLLVGCLMTVPYGLARLRGAEQYEPPRDAFVIVPQKLSTVLLVMILWRSLLSVGDEVMTCALELRRPPLDRRPYRRRRRPIRSRPRSSTRSTTTRAGGRATRRDGSEPDDARLERCARADRQLCVGVPRRAPALGRRAGIEQQQAVAVVAHGQVRVTEADDARTGKRARRRSRRPRSGPGVVHERRLPRRRSRPSARPAGARRRPSRRSCRRRRRAAPGAASSSSSAASVTSPVCRMRSASAQAASSARGQRSPAPRPEVRVARDDDADLRHTMVQESDAVALRRRASRCRRRRRRRGSPCPCRR